MSDFHCHYSLLSPQIQHRVANRKIFSGRPFAVKGDLKLGRHESVSSCWTKTYSFLASNLKNREMSCNYLFTLIVNRI